MSLVVAGYNPRYLPVRARYNRYRDWLGWLCGGVAVLAFIIWCWVQEVPQKLWFGMAQGVAAAGFQVDTINIAGLHNTPRLAVYAAVLAQNSNSMLLVDLDDVRTRIEAISWVEHASVARRLPDTLEITIVERQPAAVWQRRGRLALLDSDGRIMDRVTPRRYYQSYSALPIVVGQGAETEAPRLWSLLKSQPDLKARLRAATFVGERRWDLKFTSGETLALPEGYDEAARAFGKFADLQSRVGLLGRGFVRFDMRLDDRLVVRRAPATPANGKDSVPARDGMSI